MSYEGPSVEEIADKVIDKILKTVLTVVCVVSFCIYPLRFIGIGALYILYRVIKSWVKKNKLDK